MSLEQNTEIAFLVLYNPDNDKIEDVMEIKENMGDDEEYK